MLGTLIECDPSIRALILTIDQRNDDIIIEELDETHLFIDSSKVEYVKQELAKLLDENTFNPAQADAGS